MVMDDGLSMVLCTRAYINVVIELVQICTNCTRNRSHACMLCMNPHMSLSQDDRAHKQ